MTCVFCDNNNPELKEWKIKEYQHWVIYLKLNQCYLGSCLVKLKRHLEDFFDVNEGELKEFFEITKNLRNATKQAFGADMFNYSFLGNSERHVHLHFIPRYSKKVDFNGCAFEDTGWGKHYRLYERNDFEAPQEIKLAILNRIKKELDDLME